MFKTSSALLLIALVTIMSCGSPNAISGAKSLKGKYTVWAEGDKDFLEENLKPVNGDDYYEFDGNGNYTVYRNKQYKRGRYFITKSTITDSATAKPVGSIRATGNGIMFFVSGEGKYQHCMNEEGTNKMYHAWRMDLVNDGGAGVTVGDPKFAALAQFNRYIEMHASARLVGFEIFDRTTGKKVKDLGTVDIKRKGNRLYLNNDSWLEFVDWKGNGYTEVHWCSRENGSLKKVRFKITLLY